MIFIKYFRDFIYDKNDLLIALAILIVAGLLISWRLNIIMDYPQTLAAKTGTVTTSNEYTAPNSSDKTDAEADDSGDVIKDGILTKGIAVTVYSGSASAAIQCLIDAGLFSSQDDYAKVCKSIGRDPNQIKATTYIFRKGTSQKQIARKVTQ